MIANNGDLIKQLEFFARELAIVVRVGETFVPITEVNLNILTKPTRLEIQHAAQTGTV